MGKSRTRVELIANLGAGWVSVFRFTLRSFYPWEEVPFRTEREVVCVVWKFWRKLESLNFFWNRTTIHPARSLATVLIVIWGFLTLQLQSEGLLKKPVHTPVVQQQTRFKTRNNKRIFKTLRTGDAGLRFYITTVQDGWRKSAFLTRACFPCTINLIMQFIVPVSEWSCWRMFVETWPHSELNFRHRASSI